MAEPYQWIWLENEVQGEAVHVTNVDKKAILLEIVQMPKPLIAE